MQEYFTIAEEAARRDVSPRQIYRWLAAGYLKAVKFGNSTRITSESSAAFDASRPAFQSKAKAA